MKKIAVSEKNRAAETTLGRRTLQIRRGVCFHTHTHTLIFFGSFRSGGWGGCVRASSLLSRVQGRDPAFNLKGCALSYKT